MKKTLSAIQQKELIETLSRRFEQNSRRHTDIVWTDVVVRLKNNPDKLWSLNEMEASGGEPDVIGYDKDSGEYLFCDCSAESPTGRRSVCYDLEALNTRKKFKPENNAVDMAAAMGIELLSEEQYHTLQAIDTFDTKTSSWLKTPSEIRERGGAIFGDFRFGRVFIYHNGAESYYAARGFRGLLRV